jgi:hypothetical protein
LLTALTVWCILNVSRRGAHQASVDDYFNSLLARDPFRSFRADPVSGLRAVLKTGATAPLVPVLAAPLTHLDGVEGGIAINLPLLLILMTGAYLLARRWTTPTAATFIAGVATLNAAVLGWSQMFNFSLAATALVVWTFAAYFYSDRFHHWPWSIATGVAVALLLLSRTIALVYAALLVLVIAAHTLFGSPA